MRTSLDKTVEHIIQDEEFPALSNRLHLLMGVGDEDQSAEQLVDLVLQDYGLTLKVLKVANSFQYNRSSRPIDSVSRAVLVMGVRTVQGLASGLALFEHYQRRSPALRRLMLLSMLTAHHSSVAAEALELSTKEDAHLAGMFRNLGEVLVACHCSSEYRRIATATGDGRQSAQYACIRTLGFTYEAIARAIGGHWRMPPAITAVWQPLEDRAATDDLTALCQFAHDLTTIVYRLDAGGLETRIQLVAMRHAARLRLDEDAIAAIVDRAVLETQDIFDALRMTVNDVRNGPSAGRRVGVVA